MSLQQAAEVHQDLGPYITSWDEASYRTLVSATVPVDQPTEAPLRNLATALSSTHAGRGTIANPRHGAKLAFTSRKSLGRWYLKLAGRTINQEHGQQHMATVTGQV